MACVCEGLWLGFNWVSPVSMMRRKAGCKGRGNVAEVKSVVQWSGRELEIPAGQICGGEGRFKCHCFPTPETDDERPEVCCDGRGCSLGPTHSTALHMSITSTCLSGHHASLSLLCSGAAGHSASCVFECWLDTSSVHCHVGSELMC